MNDDDKVILVSIVIAAITGVLLFFIGLGLWRLLEPYI
jgi:hypothetical protein